MSEIYLNDSKFQVLNIAEINNRRKAKSTIGTITFFFRKNNLINNSGDKMNKISFDKIKSNPKNLIKKPFCEVIKTSAIKKELFMSHFK